ncbi:hypothetical protein D3C74_486080 [compost metagenome]
MRQCRISSGLFNLEQTAEMNICRVMLAQNPHCCSELVHLFVLEWHDRAQFFNQQQHLVCPILILIKDRQIA